MGSPLHLRCLDPAFCAMRNALLAQPTQDIRLARPDGVTRYTMMDATLDGYSCKAYVQAQALIDYWLGNASVPVDMLEQPVLEIFLKESYRTDGMPPLIDQLTLHAPVQLLSGDDIGAFLFHVSVKPFDIWLDRLPWACCLPAPSAPANLPVTLSWTLPGPILRVAELMGLTAGDALHVSDRPGVAWAGNVPIANFYLQGNHLMLVPNTEDAPIDPEQYSEEVFNAEDLPVQTTFLLATQTLTVGAIAAWRAGSTLALPMTTPQVTVVSGSRILARGELVRVGENLAVELNEVKVANENIETEDSE